MEKVKRYTAAEVLTTVGPDKVDIPLFVLASDYLELAERSHRLDFFRDFHEGLIHCTACGGKGHEFNSVNHTETCIVGKAQDFISSHPLT